MSETLCRTLWYSCECDLPAFHDGPHHFKCPPASVSPAARAETPTLDETLAEAERIAGELECSSAPIKQLGSRMLRQLVRMIRRQSPAPAARAETPDDDYEGRTGSAHEGNDAVAAGIVLDSGDPRRRPAARAEEIGGLLDALYGAAYEYGHNTALCERYSTYEHRQFSDAVTAARAAVDERIAVLVRERDELRQASDALLVRVVAAGVFKNVESVPEVIALRAAGGPSHDP